jgi:2'-5' RNA ligase
VELPTPAREAIETAVAPWRAEFPRARWVPEANWHVTLKFLGSTWPRLSEWVPEQVAQAAAMCPTFGTRLDGLGAFPSPRRARVVWVGLDDRAGRMAELVRALDASLATEFRAETRSFTPHVTAARSDPPIALPDTFAATPVQAVPFHVDRVTLFRSHLRRPAPRYEALDSFPLGE